MTLQIRKLKAKELRYWNNLQNEMPRTSNDCKTKTKVSCIFEKI
jgi:hypothetical protein